MRYPVVRSWPGRDRMHFISGSCPESGQQRRHAGRSHLCTRHMRCGNRSLFNYLCGAFGGVRFAEESDLCDHIGSSDDRPLLLSSLHNNSQNEGSAVMVGFSSIRRPIGTAARRGVSLATVVFVLAGAAFIFTGGAAASLAFILDLLASSPTMTDRMVRDGVQSTCAATKAYPGDFGTTATYRYSTSTITNGITGCLTFKVVQGGTCAHFSLYSPTFNPANRAMNYRGDTGNPGNGREMSVRLL